MSYEWLWLKEGMDIGILKPTPLMWRFFGFLGFFWGGEIIAPVWIST